MANGRAACEHVAAGSNEGAMDTISFKGFHGFVDGEALGNAPEVELHVGGEQGDGAVTRIESYFFIADAIFYGSQGDGAWKFLLFASGAPKADHRAGGNVKCAISFAGKDLGALEDFEKIATDFDGVALGFLAKAIEFAGGMVVRENCVEGFDAGVGFARNAFGGGAVFSIKLEMKIYTHLGVHILEALPRGIIRQTAAAAE
jgi:hypothetical protein